VVVGIDAAACHECAANIVSTAGEGHGGAVDAGAGGVDVVDDDHALWRAILGDREAAAGPVRFEDRLTQMARAPESVSTCVTNVEGSVIGELLKAVLCRR
jgi:hypothetical protein